MWRQRAKQRLEAEEEEMSEFLDKTGADCEQERPRFKDKMQQNKILDAVFNPRVRLHRLVFPADVQQMVLIKEEAPEEWRPGVDQKDPETLNIKEEEEELWTSLEGEQLSVKEETDDPRFPFTAVPLKSEDDEENLLFSQLHQHQVEDGDLPTCSSAEQMKGTTGGEDCGGAEPTRNPDLNTDENDSNSTETEVSEADEDDEDVLDPDSELKDFSDSGSEPEDSDKDWKESRAPESGVNTVNKPFSCSECGKQFVHKLSLQRHMTCHSRIMSSTNLVHKKCFRVKKTGGSSKKIQSGQKPFACDVCGQRFGHKSSLNKHMIVHTGQKPFACDVCGQRFGRKSHLNTHMRVHTRRENGPSVNIKTAPKDT